MLAHRMKSNHRHDAEKLPISRPKGTQAHSGPERRNRCKQNPAVADKQHCIGAVKEVVLSRLNGCTAEPYLGIIAAERGNALIAHDHQRHIQPVGEQPVKSNSNFRAVGIQKNCAEINQGKKQEGKNHQELNAVIEL